MDLQRFVPVVGGFGIAAIIPRLWGSLTLEITLGVDCVGPNGFQPAYHPTAQLIRLLRIVFLTIYSHPTTQHGSMKLVVYAPRGHQQSVLEVGRGFSPSRRSTSQWSLHGGERDEGHEVGDYS